MIRCQWTMSFVLLALGGAPAVAETGADAAEPSDRLALAGPAALMAPLAIAAEDEGEGEGMHRDRNLYGPNKGDWELTLGGSGSNDEDFDNGGFSISGSIGYFLDESWEIVLRQSVSFSNFGESSWNGSTRVALDYHFDLDRFRPFVGINVGGIYGEDVDETGAAGLEAGLKWYVKQETFIMAMAEYQFFFESADDVDDNFDNGQFLYTLGIGFNF